MREGAKEREGGRWTDGDAIFPVRETGDACGYLDLARAYWWQYTRWTGTLCLSNAKGLNKRRRIGS